MMQNFITPSRIANSILQKHSFKGSYIIVEGKSDFTVYKKFSHEELCQVEIAFGNSNVIEVVEELNKRGYNDAIGIIDADFLNRDNQTINNENILMTDEHDLELMILRSNAFNIVIDHYGNQDRIESFLKEHNTQELKDIFLQLAKPLGYLKWANKKNGFGLIFKPLTPEGKPLPIIDFIPFRTLKFSGYEKLIEVVFNYSRQKSDINVSPKDCLKITTALIDEDIDVYQLCNGHDVSTIICIALRNKIASLNSKALQAEQFEEALIFSYDSRFFETTNLYRLIKEWEKRNNRTVLKF